MAPREACGSAAPGEADKLSGIKVALREADWLSGRNAAPMETQTSCHGRRRQSGRQANCQGIKLAKLDVWEADKDRDTG